jgi:CRISPR/Cas system-associated protein Cas5 (RAMP superfamily)
MLFVIMIQTHLHYETRNSNNQSNQRRKRRIKSKKRSITYFNERINKNENTKQITMKKIEVSFNQTAYETNLASLNLNIEKIVNCQTAIEKIKGSRELCSLEDIEKFITDATKFKNISLSANLLNCSSEYQYLEANLNKLSLEVVEWNNNIPSTKKEVLEQVKIANTTFLRDCFIQDFEILKKATDLLNSLSNTNLVVCLKKDYTNKYSVNLNHLNNSDRI